MPPLSVGYGAETAASKPRNRAEAFLSAIFCGFAALLPVISVVAPKGLVVLLLLAAILAVPAFWWAYRRFPVPDLRVTIVLALLVLWCAVASSWSPDAIRSLVLALRIAVIFAAGLVLFPIAAALDESTRARIGWWLVGGFAAILALTAVEIGFGFPLLRSLEVPAPGYELVWFNRGVVAMALIVWPVAAFLWGRAIGWRALGIPVALGLASFFMESAAATLCLAVGIVAALLVVSHRKAGRPLTIVAVVLAVAAMPFAAREIHDHGWHRADWLFGSARHRVAIWDFSVELIAEKPLLGWGFDSSRHVGERFSGIDGNGQGTTPLHPHNAPLQIMLELGAVGAAIALALLCLIALRLDNVSSRGRDCGQALFVAALTVGGLAFGIWQNWWLALIVSVALLVPLTAVPAVRDKAIRQR